MLFRGGIILNLLQGFILGIIQGLTEFLPVSSSGHLVLFQRVFGLKEGVLTFDVAVHLATLIGVAAVLRDDIAAILKKPFGKLPLLIIAGTIPTLIIGAVFSDFFKKLFESGISLGFEFILTGLVLLYADRVRGRKKGIDEMKYSDAAIIGVAQGIAILPAVSRSGFTIAGALLRGLKKEVALKFSFLMSIPAILAAAAKDIYDCFSAGGAFAEGPGIWPLLAGMLAAAVSGYFAVRFMLKVFSKASLKVFSYYVLALGALVLIDQFFYGRFFGKLF